MKRQLPFYLLFLSVALTSCFKDQNNKSREGKVTISGKLENVSDSFMFLEELTPTDVLFIDSIKVNSEGSFFFENEIEDVGFYRIGFDNSNFFTLSIAPNENIEITGNADDLPLTYSLSGSRESILLWELNQEKNAALHQIDSLRLLFIESKYEPDFVQTREMLREEYRNVRDGFRSYVLTFIDEHPNQLISLLALYQNFDGRVLLKDTDYLDYFEKLSRSLCNTFPGNKHVLDLKKRVGELNRQTQQRLENEKNLAQGMPAPDILLPDTAGNGIALSSLQGKLVLLDFWAGWCPPCRTANVELVPVYERFRDSGFEIFGVSLDRTRDQWLKAIHEDGVEWLQVSDLRFMNSPVVSLYNIDNIPYNVFIDREGNIVEREIDTERLIELLEEYL